MGYGYDGFWKSMDTFKEETRTGRSGQRGQRSRQVWKLLAQVPSWQRERKGDQGDG